MVVKRQCSFCAQEIEPGTGMMFVRRDGTVFHFCSSSCRKQQLHLHRVGHRFKWTRAHELKRAADRSSAEKAPAAPAGTRPGRIRSARRAESGTAAPTPAPAAPAPSAETEKAPEPPEGGAAAEKKPRRSRKKADASASE
jgi:large subunit ribosomal protein L24e